MIVTLLGTGTPFPRIERFGTAILAEAAGQALLFDCGRGATIRLHQAGVLAARVTSVFLTHLHSDHVSGLSDLWLTGWLLGRDVPLNVCGPPGTRQATERLVRSCAAHVDVCRTAGADLRAKGAGIRSRAVRPGVIYEYGGARVIAFAVDHGQETPAYGYRLEHGHLAVVVSADTRRSAALTEAAQGADVLFHAACVANATGASPSDARSIASAEDAGRVFAHLNPGLAVVYHYGEEDGLEEGVRRFYRGPLVIGRDGTRIEVNDRHPADLMTCDSRSIV